jgi:hypothetical protein
MIAAERPASIVYRTETCPICFDDLGKTNVATTSCGHVFCLKCISKHVAEGNGDCPMCKSEFVEDLKRHVAPEDETLMLLQTLHTHVLVMEDQSAMYRRKERRFRYKLMMMLGDNNLMSQALIDSCNEVDELTATSHRYLSYRRHIMDERQQQRQQPQQQQQQQQQQQRRKCGVCRQHGHDRRRCPTVQR